MNMSVRYLGHQLAHPFITGASPLVDDLDVVRRLEDAGAAGIVMRSLFEEQIVEDELSMALAVDGPAYAFGEATTYLPEPQVRGADDYLEMVARVRSAVDVPIFGSLNGVHGGRWLGYAEEIIEAGADALELNLYYVPTDPDDSASVLEERLLEMVQELKSRVDAPVAIKLSPYYTSPANFARALIDAGVDALVLFNRFYQADIDPEELDVTRTLKLSDPSELLLRIRWLAILSAQLPVPLAVTGGVHTAIDAVKAVMAGASVVQLVSTLLKNGPEQLAVLKRDFEAWLEQHEYDSLTEMRGSLNMSRSPDPEAFERANYREVLRSWRGFS
jgi:dihydroorotate dehydrogenase (fumarate)